MKYSIQINQIKAVEWDLTMSETIVFSWLYELPSWADKYENNGISYYHASRKLAIQELPLVSDKDNTFYSIYKNLQEKNLVDYKKIDNKDYIAITEKGKEWYFSDLNQTLGKKSEPLKNIQKNSDLNQTHHNTNNNNNYNNNNAREEKNLGEKVETDKPLYAEEENPNPQTYFDEAKNSPIWKEQVAMRYEITKNEVPEYLDKFQQECLCKETTHLSMNDFKSHFCNWLRIQIKEKKETSKKTKQTNPNQGMPIGMRGQVKGKDFTEDWSQAEQATKKIYTEDWNI